MLRVMLFLHKCLTKAINKNMHVCWQKSGFKLFGQATVVAMIKDLHS